MTALQPEDQGSLWHQVATTYGPGFAANRYVARILYRARGTDPLGLLSTPEDNCRLASAIKAVIELHRPTPRGRCDACTGAYLVDWPCPTRRAVDTGLRDGWTKE